MQESNTPQEDDFWVSLEFRISREFPGMPDKRLQRFWCDGFTPHKYFLDDPVPRIVGHAWMCEDQNQQEWEFTLFLRRRYPSREAIEWWLHLPGPNVTCWVAMDIEGKRVQMEPAAAVPDFNFEPPKKRNAQNRSLTSDQNHA
jgi:hypothetical protein